MYKTNRPGIKLQLKPADIVIEILGWIALAGLWIYVIVNYQNLPEIVPIHFGAGGVPDGYGSKDTTFISAGIATALFIFMLFMQRRPHTFNYVSEITPENAVRQYTNAVRMVRVLKMCICLVFIVIEYSTTVTMAEEGKADAKWMFLGIFLLVQLPLFYFLIQSSKDK